MFIVHWKQYYFNNCFLSFWISRDYELCKRIAFFLNYCSHEMNTFLIQNIWHGQIHKKTCSPIICMYIHANFRWVLPLADTGIRYRTNSTFKRLTCVERRINRLSNNLVQRLPYPDLGDLIVDLHRTCKHSKYTCLYGPTELIRRE